MVISNPCRFDGRDPNRSSVADYSMVAAQLGYGCSQLMGGITRRESIALLETAFDAGIRHFDTAPSYGYGEAERVLGEALYGKRHEVTITTKYGLRSSAKSSLRAAAGILRPVVRHLPIIKGRLSRAAQRLTPRPQFSLDGLRQSIDASLKALRTDYIDILLLHEATLSDLNDDLFQELEGGLNAGKLRSFGIGSELASAIEIHRYQRRFCPVLQFEWSVLDCENPVYPESRLITHRSVSHNFVRLREWLSDNPQVARRWSNELDRDIEDASVIARLMLAAAFNANHGGITLFSSRKAKNIRGNADLRMDASSLSAATAFAILVAKDVPPKYMRTFSGSLAAPAVT
jgi:D-threo-aldose 1-dehydrogenase